jgi:TetR/AcrR family transcriptional repressor of nem operon
VARYGRAHKEATRRRILDAAGRRFKRDGIAGSGIASLMADAGLTNGAFYAHFASKDDLVARTVADELRRQQERYLTLPPGADVELVVRGYLSVEHRDNPPGGCPSAALLEEIGRADDTTKQAYTEGMLAVADELAAVAGLGESTSARAVALSAFAMMIGTLQLSRALSDRHLADQVLDQGVNDTLALLNRREL